MDSKTTQRLPCPNFRISSTVARAMVAAVAVLAPALPVSGPVLPRTTAQTAASLAQTQPLPVFA